MDYRGSKSVAGLLSAAVKEQRVDGNGQEKLFSCLRYTLTGLERDSDINILSKQINKRFYSSLSGANLIDEIESTLVGSVSTSQDPSNSCVNQGNIEMDPYFFTGFSDGEASFILYIQKSNDTKIGWVS